MTAPDPTPAVREAGVEGIAAVLAEALMGGWDDADARDAGRFLAPIVERIIVERERAAAYFAMWQFFLRLPGPSPLSDAVQRESMRLRAALAPETPDA